MIKFENLLKAISKIPHLPKINLKQALNSPPNFLEPYIFKAVEIQFRSTIVRTWMTLFPYYISKDLIYLVSLYEELEEVSSKDEIFNILKK